MKVIKRIFLYLISFTLLVSLGWILFWTVGTIPQAKNIFADRLVFEMIVPGALLIVLLMGGIAAWSQGWKEYSVKAGIVVSGMVIFILQVFYISLVKIYIGHEQLLMLNEAVKMIDTQTLNLEIYDTNAIVMVLYGLLKGAKVIGLQDLHWIPCIWGMICIDFALLFAAKIVWKIKGSRMCFLFIVFCMLNPVLYIWIPWCSPAISILPFLFGSLYFLIAAGSAESVGKRIGSLVLMVLMLGIGIVFWSADKPLEEKESFYPDLLQEIEQEENLWEIAEKAALVWQDGSAGFVQEELYPQEYSRGYLYICGEKNDMFLAYMQMYHAAALLLSMIGICLSAVKNRGGLWLFLKVVMLGNFVSFILWNVPAGYTIPVMLLLGLLSVDGLTWEKHGDSSKQTWIIYGTGCVIMLGMTAFFLIGQTLREDIHWRDFTVHNTVAEGISLQGLTDDDTVVQTFTASSTFDTIYVDGYFSGPELASGGCRIELIDEKGQVLNSKELTAEEIVEQQIYLKCDIISPLEKTTYAIRITPINVTEEHALCLRRFNGAMDLYPFGTLKQNHEYQEGDLVFSVYKDNIGSYWG